jgi:hypothetical protein
LLRNLSKEIRDCYARAAHCDEKAKSSFTPEMRADFLRLRDSWLKLARSYEFAEQLRDFSRETERKRAQRRLFRPNGGGTIQ